MDVHPVAPPPPQPSPPTPPTTRWSELRRGLRDVVFPPVCVGCGVPPEGGALRHVCAACEARIFHVGAPCCVTCGHPFFGEARGEHLCEHCEGLQPVYREGRTAVLLRGPIRPLVHQLKYHRGRHVVPDIVTIFSRGPALLDWAHGAVLVPVPLHPRKERERGYNQSALIAEALATALGDGPRVEPLLVRVRDTQTQTRFARAARRANLKNAFALRPGAAVIPTLRYLIVDDVFTTGSTLNSCADALRRGGALSVDVVTFGHG